MKLEGTKEELEAMKKFFESVTVCTIEEEQKEKPLPKIPRGYTIKRESKSERTSIVFRPSTLSALRAAAEEKGTSFNELCNEILENYLKGAKAK